MNWKTSLVVVVGEFVTRIVFRVSMVFTIENVQTKQLEEEEEEEEERGIERGGR